MASPRLLVSAGWLLGLVAFAGCGDSSGHGSDMSTGGDDLASSGPTVGGTVTNLVGSGLVLQNNGGDDLSVTAAGPFAFGTPLADGASYDVSIKTQPTNQLCAVSNGKGTIAGGSVASVTVRCSPVVRFVLVADKSDASVGTFVLEATSGRLRYAGKSATGTSPASVATDPAGHWAYVANSGDGTVSQYSIDGNGRLKPLSPATVTVGTGVSAVAVDPAGAHAYVTRTGGMIAAYAIGADGTLSALTPAGSGSANPVAIVVEPSGRFAYAASASDGSVAQLKVGADGTLTSLPTATIPAGTAPSGIAVDPTGHFLYVTDSSGAVVTQFTIGSDGTLTANGTAPAGAGAASPVVDPSGRFAFVVNGGDKTIAQYSIGSDGKLTPAATATVPAGTGAAAVIVDGTGHSAFVANAGDDNIGQYAIGSSGTLTAIAPATVPGQKAPAALALVGGTGFAQPTATHAFVSDNTGSIRDFPVGADGKLGTPTSMATTSRFPASIVLDAGGTHAYVLDASPVGGPGNILQFAVSAAGAWSALTPASVAAGASPAAIALHPSGRFAYVVNDDATADTVSQFAVGADGLMTPLGTPTVSTATAPVGVAVDPTGRFAYVVTNAVTQYAVGADGTLTLGTAATIPVGAQPAWIAIEPSGRFAYVANNNGSSVLQYSIDATDGHLTALVPASIASGTGPLYITFDPAGRYAYVVNNTVCTLSQYTLGSGGLLSALSPATVAAGDCGTAMDYVAFAAVDPSGRFLYVPDEDASSSTVLQYGLGASGALSPLTPAATSTLNSAHLLQLAFLVRYQ